MTTQKANVTWTKVGGESWVDTGDAVVYVQHLTDPPNGVTTVSIDFTLPNDVVYYATGSSKATKEDPFDKTVGLELAYGRALRSLGRKLLASGHGKVHELDNFKKAQHEASEKAIARRKQINKKLQAKTARKSVKAKKK
jgi:hypothetical protein